MKKLENAGEIVKFVDPANPFKGIIYSGPKDLKESIFGIINGLLQNSFGKDAIDIFSIEVIEKVEKIEEEKKEIQEPILSLNGTEPVGYFGHSLTTGDFNGDSIPDLVAGSYGVGEAGHA